jgi:hypothetical protein
LFNGYKHHSKMPITSKSRAKKVVARYPARQRSKPERFSDVQLSLTVGKYHGSKDTYVRKYVQHEKIINENKKPDGKLAGYASDGGFVLGDNEGLERDSEEDEDEEEMEFDDDSEEEEELELED